MPEDKAAGEIVGADEEGQSCNHLRAEHEAYTTTRSHANISCGDVRRPGYLSENRIWGHRCRRMSRICLLC